MSKRNKVSKMKKNFGFLYIFGHIVEESQIRTVLYPSEEMLDAEVERRFEGIRSYLTAKGDILSDPEGVKRALRLGLKPNLTVHLNRQDGHLRIDSDGFGITNITEVAKAYSASLNAPILFWSGFDDSIMILGVAIHGEVQTIHIVSDEKHDSSFASRKGNDDIFKKYIPIVDDNAFNKLILETDIFIAQDLVPQSFGISA